MHQPGSQTHSAEPPGFSRPVHLGSAAAPPNLVMGSCIHIRWLPRFPCDRCVDCVWCCSEVACLPQDPDGSYIARWVPELARLPKKYLHMPWKAAEDTLRAAGVSFGSSEGQYPHRITTEVMQVILLSCQCCCKVAKYWRGSVASHCMCPVCRCCKLAVTYMGA